VVTGPGEQPLPGLAGAGRVTVIVAGGQAGRGRVTWTAAVSRVEPGSGEWDEVIGPLVAGRLNAVLAEGETSPAQRWARSGAVFRLAPVLEGRAFTDPPAPNSRTVLSAALPGVHPGRRLAGHRQRRHSHQRHSHQCGGFLMHGSFRSLLAVAAPPAGFTWRAGRSPRPPIVNSSADPALDALNGPGVCRHGAPMGGIQDRCGYGQRLPLLIISPCARADYVSRTITDQTSVLAFVEDNWLGGQRTGGSSFDNLAGSLDNMFSWAHPSFAPYLLDPATGEPAR